MASTMPVVYEWLMPLAPWEPAERLVESLESLYQQTWPAQRLVVSVDGQLSAELAEVLEKRQLPLPVLVLQSESWQGTGATLAAGLSACRCEWILRADADDISTPDRAEQQLSFLQKNPHITVLGGQLYEASGEKSRAALRQVPLRAQEIRRTINWRNPINHPTVVLNRRKVLQIGNYRSILGFEDWDLWLRLNKRGAILQNLPDVVVKAQTGSNHLKRRHGSRYAKHEFRFLLRCCRENLIPGWRVAFLMLTRLPWRLLPTFSLAYVMGILRTQPKSE